MMTRHLFCFAAQLVLTGCLAGVGVRGAEPEKPGTPAPAANFPLPSTPGPGFSDMVVEPRGCVWVMANHKLFYWTGSEFREPVSGPMQTNSYLAGLYGGPDRGIFATQPGQHDHEGQIYCLSDGAAHLLTTFYYEVAHEYPGLYVSRSGAIFNWGNQFLARFSGDAWQRTEARLALRDTCIFDLGEHVYFYYDNHLYRAGNDGFHELEPPEWRDRQPGPKVVGVLWDKTRALLVNHRQRAGIFAFDLPSCREIPLDQAREALRTTEVYDAFSLPDGSVWLLGLTRGDKASTFFHLDTDGSVKPVVSTRELPWENIRCWQYPHSVVVASSGAIVFGLPQDGIAIWQDGKLRRCGWREGFVGEVQQIAEDTQGNLWVPMGGNMARFRVDTGEVRLPPTFEDWTEYLLVHRTRIWEVEPGRLAMFRADKPGVLSRWDGTKWSFQPVPFDPSQIGRSMVDDKGHLLVTMIAKADGVHDVGPEKVESFDAVGPLLTAAAKRGAKEFQQCTGFQGAIVTDSNQIWFGYDNHNSVQLIEAGRTDKFSFREGMHCLFPSTLHGVLVGPDGGPFHYLDRGQWVDTESLFGAKKLLLGEKGFQPYERALATPPKLYPVRWVGSERRVYFSAEGFEAAANGTVSDVPSAPLPRYVERLYPSVMGGAWLECFQGGGAPVRLLAQRSFDLDLSQTPIGKWTAWRAREDSEGNLWLETRPYSGTGHAFMRRLSHVRLTLDPVPPECGRELRLSLNVTPEQYAPQVQGLVRLGESDWTAAETDGRDLVVRFPRSGDYSGQVSGVVMGARLQSSPDFSVTARVELPDTLHTD